jgi:hypothetical protein
VVVDVLAQDEGVLEKSRSFYGTLQVELEERAPQAPDRLWLANGATFHGFQFRDPLLRASPTAYFTRGSGGGFALSEHPRRRAGLPLKVGVLGLGVGTLAAYGQPGDTFRFYEINPDVVRIANDPRYFTYLSDCKAKVEMVIDDARLALERELAAGTPQGFDVLVLDVFNSDSVPAHLLTRQAFEVYLAHLRDRDSLLAVHISNTSLDLAPLLWSTADTLSLQAMQLFHQPDAAERDIAVPASWMLLGRRLDVLAAQGKAPHVRARPQKALPAVWTDDFSNLVSVLMPAGH